MKISNLLIALLPLGCSIDRGGNFDLNIDFWKADITPGDRNITITKTTLTVTATCATAVNSEITVANWENKKVTHLPRHIC